MLGEVQQEPEDKNPYARPPDIRLRHLPLDAQVLRLVVLRY
jgi:hypothetical protein